MLAPLAELAPELTLPDGRTLAQALAALGDGQRVERVASLTEAHESDPARAIIDAMLLAIDVGNTQTHIGAFDGTELVEHWRFSTDREATGDELAVHGPRPARRCAGSSFADIDAEVVSSVVPQLVPEYRRMFERYLDREALIVGPGTKTGCRSGSTTRASWAPTGS